MAASKNHYDAFCHEVRNGLLAIEGIIRKYRKKRIGIETCLKEIEKRCERMDQMLSLDEKKKGGKKK